MLAIQEYLRSGNTLEDVASEFAINVFYHPTLSLVGFKYNQIDSPKTHPVVRDCRGIVLERDTWNVVAKPFRRFFNVGEDAENFAKFNWSDFTVTTKEDGSLMLLFFYEGEWHVNTSGSFGLKLCYHSGKTWQELFWEISQIDRNKLDPEYTYIFEMWSPYNIVVRAYPAPFVSLLSMFHVPTLGEVSVTHADETATNLGVNRPDHHHFQSIEEITSFLMEMENKDKSYEGVVIRDNVNERYKCKSKSYVALHHLIDNGNLFNPKRLVPLLLSGEIDEVLAYVPVHLAGQLKPHLETIQAKLDESYNSIRDLWMANHQIVNQKEFALKIVDKHPFSHLLFDTRRHLGDQNPETALRNKWRESSDFITKEFYG